MFHAIRVMARRHFSLDLRSTAIHFTLLLKEQKVSGLNSTSGMHYS